MKIGNVEIKNNIFLAPMAGVTDVVFRRICKDFGAGMVYTELVSSKGLLYENENTHKLLEVDEKERPIGFQIFGSDPKILSEVAKKIEHMDFDVLDINMGCPAPKVVKNGEGSALMKEPKKIGEIVKAVSSAIEKPVTIKIRKGFDDSNVNAVEICKIAEENGAKAVTIHGRTREEYYSGTADWEIIRKAKEAVSIPIIGNGDVYDCFQAEKMFKETGCDGIMIGRGSEGNPWIFKDVNHYLETGTVLPKVSIDEKIDTALYHARMLIKVKGDFIGVREMRKHIGWYTKNLPGSAEIRFKINKAETYEEVEEILNSMI